MHQKLSSLRESLLLKCPIKNSTFLPCWFRVALGVESNWNSFEIHSIRLIRKGKNSSKNLTNFNSKFVRFERKKFEKFANFSNSVFWFEKFEIYFLSNNILCYSIMSFGFKGTMFWKYIINHHVYLHFICGWPKSKYFTHIW